MTRVGAIVALALVCPSIAGAQVLYSNAFDSGVAGAEWSNRRIAVSPSGRTFLGQFASETADLTLTIPQAPAGARVKITFDLFIIASWDGNANACSAPGEEWSFSVDGTAQLRTSFSNTFSYCGNRQMYPAALGSADWNAKYAYPGQTGAAEVDALGYGSGLWGDAVYRMAFVLPLPAGTHSFRFAASNVQGGGDESWGLDNVKVEVVPAPAAAPGQTLAAWGGNAYGQVGAISGSVLPRPVGVPLADGSVFTGVAQVTGGDAHSVALGTDGTVWTWGSNSYGQLGDWTTTFGRAEPRSVSLPAATASIAAGTFHTVAVGADGAVRAWGKNDVGQLGDGTVTNRLSPVLVRGLSAVVAAAAGNLHSAALRSDGTVWTWGGNTLGQLGNGSTVSSQQTPVQVPLTNVVAIAAGQYHTVALRGDGTVWTWGSNQQGQLGTGDLAERRLPAQVPMANVIAVAAGAFHTFALRADGGLWAWGFNSSGQLGDGSTTNRVVPQPAAPAAWPITAVASGTFHTVVMRSDGTVWTFGANGQGQLGDGTTITRTSPVQMILPDGTAAKGFGIGAGANHTFGIGLLQKVVSILPSVLDFGELAVGSSGPSQRVTLINHGAVPVKIFGWAVHPTPPDFAVAASTCVAGGQLAVGGGCTIDIAFRPQIAGDRTGTLEISTDAGDSPHKTILEGIGTAAMTLDLPSTVTAAEGTPFSVSGAVTVNTGVTLTRVEVDANYDGVFDETLAFNSANAFTFTHSYADNGTFAIGVRAIDSTGAAVTRTIAVTVQNVAPTVQAPVTQTAVAGVPFTVAGTIIDPGADVWTATIEYGDGAAAQPLAVSGRTFQTGAGFAHAYSMPGVFTATITVTDDEGVTGTFAFLVTVQQLPTAVALARSPTQASFGGVVRLAATVTSGASTVPTGSVTFVDGSVTLGTASLTNGAAALLVSSLSAGTHAIRAAYTGTVTYAASESAEVAVTVRLNPGQLRTSGMNDTGQLGIGSTISSAALQRVDSLSDVISVAAGAAHALALRSNGTVWAWGSNWAGQLGTGNTIRSLAPIQVPGLQGIIAISAGEAFSVALRNDGKVLTWGTNGSGELASGGATPDHSVAPQVVGALPAVVAIATGPNHALALTADGKVWGWGLSGDGQLGTFDVFNVYTSIAIPIGDVIAIAGGEQHSVALRSDGSVWTWGRGESGQFGDGRTVATARPTQAGINGVVAIATGEKHTVALKSDGTVWVWGDAPYGQLGNGTSGQVNLPVQVSNLADVVAIAATHNRNSSSRDSHDLAITSDGALWAWGPNRYGQFGIGTIADAVPVPVQIPVRGVAAAAAGTRFTLSVGAPSEPTTLQLSAADVPYGAPLTVVATLGASSGPVAGATIAFDIDNNGVLGDRTAVTDAHGTAVLTVAWPDAVAFGIGSVGARSIVARFAGDATHDGSTGAATFAVTDGTPPVVTAVVSGTLGQDGWYVSDVHVEWAMADPESALLAGSGCAPVDVRSDTSGLTITCAATSAGGSTTESVTIRRDATPPEIVLTTPPRTSPAAVYALGQPVISNYACFESMSGPRECSAPVLSGDPIDTATAGVKTFTVTARDAAGNTSTATTTFVVAKGTPTLSTRSLVAATVNVGVSPYGVAVDPGTGYAYVTNHGSDTVSVIDGDPSRPTFNTVVATIGGFSRPRGISVDPEMHRVYVSNYGDGGSVSVIEGNPESAKFHTVISRVFVSGWASHGIAVNPLTSRVYVGNEVAYAWTAIDGRLLTAQGMGQGSACGPYDLAVNPKSGRLYITNSWCGNSLVIDIDPASPTFHQRIAEIPAGGLAAVEVNSITSQVYVSNPFDGQTVRIVDGGSNQVTGTVPVGGNVTDLAFDEGAALLFATIPATREVKVIDADPASASFHTVLATLPTGGGAAGVAVDRQSGRIYVANANDGTVTIFAFPGMTYGTPLAAGHLGATSLQPGSFAYDPALGTVLDAGVHRVAVTFTPDDQANYEGAAIDALVAVRRAAPVITVNGGTFTYDGLPHTAAATATGVVGEPLAPVAVTYNGSTEAPVNAGTYGVEARYAGSTNYTAAVATATIVIDRARPIVTWAEPAAIVAGTRLGSAQLNATGNVPGTFTYSPEGGTVLRLGTHTLTATFTAGPNYEPVTATVTLTVIDPTPPEITIETPAPGALFALNQAVMTVFTCLDNESGLADCDGPPTNTLALDTSTPGLRTFTVTARDLAGNIATKTVTYTVAAVSHVPATLLYVSEEADDRVAVYDGATNARLRTIPIAGGPHAMLLSRDGKTLYVAAWRGRVLSAIDLATEQVVQTYPLGRYPIAIAQSLDGATLYIANFDDSTVTIISLATGATRTIAAGPAPQSVVMTAHAAYFLVANSGADTVSVFDTASETLVKTITVGQRPSHLALSPDGTRILSINAIERTVAVIDAETLTVLNSFDGGADIPAWAGFSPDGREIYVSYPLPGSPVMRMDAATGRVIGTFAVGGYPAATAVSPHGLRAYALSSANNQLDVIDPAANALIARIPTGAHPLVVVVSPLRASIDIDSVTAPYRGRATLTARLSADGAPLAGRRVEFTYNDTLLGVGVSDAGGVATVSVQLPAIPVSADAATRRIAATFRGDEFATRASGSAALEITKARPSLTWTDVTPISYGVALGPDQLKAAADVEGAFTYDPPAGTILGAPDRTLTATFVPADTANYETGSITATIAVLKAHATVTVAGGPFTYDGQPHEATVTVTGVRGETLTGGTTILYAGNASGSPAAPVDAGVYSASVTFAGDDNYEPATGTTVLVINPAPLRIVARDATRRYAEANPAFDVDYLGLVNGETPAVLGGALVLSTDATAESPVGAYPIVPSGVTSSNYAITFVNGTVTITKAPARLLITRLTQTYTGQGISPFVDTEPPLLTGVSITYEDGTHNLPVNAGRYGLVATLTNANYEAEPFTGTLVIEAAPLTITVNDASRVFGQDNPAFSVRFAGLVNGENESVLSGTLAFATTADRASHAGTYPIAASGLASANYAITFVPGTLTIAKASLTGSFATGGTFPFDGAPHAATVRLTGVLGEDLTPLVTVSYLPGGSAPVNAGTYAVEALFDGTVDYEPAADRSVSITIVPAVTSTAASAQASAVFGEPVTVNVGVLGGGPASADGGVSILVDGRLAGVAALQPSAPGASAGQFVVTGLALGSHTIAAVYPGAPNFAGSSAPVLTLAVAPASTAVVLTASPEPSGAGEPVVLVANITPVAPGAGAPGGTVEFQDNGVVIGSAVLALVDGSYVATLTTSGMAPGSHVLTAGYAGDANFLASSGTSSHTVNSPKASTTTALVTAASAAIGEAVALDAVVGAASGSADPTGSVEFVDGGVVIGSAPLQLSKGAMHAVFTASFAAAGAHQLVARYLPDGDMSASASTPASVTIYDPADGAPVPTKTDASAPKRTDFGTPVDVAITVTPGAPPKKTPLGGVVDVFVDGQRVAQAPVSAQSASVTLTGLARGDHQIVAVFTSDSVDYSGSTSRAVTVSVR